jgi:hypothetical protein
MMFRWVLTVVAFLFGLPLGFVAIPRIFGYQAPVAVSRISQQPEAVETAPEDNQVPAPDVPATEVPVPSKTPKRVDAVKPLPQNPIPSEGPVVQVRATAPGKLFGTVRMSCIVGPSGRPRTIRVLSGPYNLHQDAIDLLVRTKLESANNELRMVDIDFEPRSSNASREP